MTDHRVEIHSAAESDAQALADYIEKLGDEFEALDTWALEVDVMTSSSSGRNIVEMTTGVGGPTTRWVVDVRDGGWVQSLTFHHSWGMDDDGDDRREYQCYVPGEPFAHVADMARSLVEVHA